jgi:hypothetical protein
LHPERESNRFDCQIVPLLIIEPSRNDDVHVVGLLMLALQRLVCLAAQLVRILRAM